MSEDLQKHAFSLYSISPEPYHKFPRVKRKKNGKKKVRWIYAPEEKLKQIQKIILKAVLYQYASHPCAHAYVAHRNIRSGAHAHCDKQFTIVLDIKDFFPSITRKMIREALSFYTDEMSDSEQNAFFAWDDRVKQAVANPGIKNTLPQGTTVLDVLCELCTYDGVIPQGAPTSGALSNIVLYPLDCLFEQVAVQHDMAYTRYADDLSFSGNDLDELKRIVFGYVFKKLNEMGFAINKRKVHVFKGHQRIVTGLNIHEEGVRPARKYRRKLRARLAGLRNKISKCATKDELLTILGDAHFMRGELGHYWYVLYADTYAGTEKMAYDYFVPIAFKIQEFFPAFLAENVSDTRSEIRKTNGRDTFIQSMTHLSREMRKMIVTQIAVDEKGNKVIPKGSLDKVFKLIALTHREKRELVHQALREYRYNGVGQAQWVRNMTESNFLTVYRLAAPEDKLNVLTTVARGRFHQRGIWFKLCLLGARHEYHDRIKLLRVLAQSKTLCGSNAERFALRRAARKIMRGLNVSDLIEFVTCNHENIRVAAQDLIAYKNQRAGIAESDG